MGSHRGCVNLKSVYLCSRAALPLMDGGGSVAYAAAKGGVESLTRAMAKELAPKGILVNAVSPGRIATPFHDRFSSPESRKGKAKSIPLGRDQQRRSPGWWRSWLPPRLTTWSVRSSR